jgi:hypothetical protein
VIYFDAYSEEARQTFSDIVYKIADNSFVDSFPDGQQEAVQELINLGLIKYARCDDMVRGVTDGLPIWGYTLTCKGYDFYEGTPIDL